MINIQKNTTNTIVLTLNELTTIDTPYYLFKFVYCSDYNNIKYFVCTDTSLYLTRYNKFNIIESSTEDPLNGTIELNPGMWDYYIYEQVSATNLDPDNAGNLVEQGKVIVEGVDSSIPLVYR